MPNASLDHTHQDSHQGSSYRRIELITGESRRRRWTAEEKARILAESFEPGAKVSEVALRHGVNRGLLWTWRRQARKRTAGGEQTFVPVRIVEEPAAPPTPAALVRQPKTAAASERATRSEGARTPAALGTIDIEIGSARVRVRGSVDASALRQVLSHIGRGS